jgi:hypothetical protein
MGFLKTFAATAVLSALIPNAVALNADSKSNVAVYYVSSLFSKSNPVSTPADSEF